MKRSTKFTTGFIIIVIALAAGIMALVLINKNQTKISTAVPTPMISADQTLSVTPSTTVIPSTNSSDWHIYQNTSYGFQITFSDIWKGYSIQQDTVPKPQVEAQYSFFLPTTDPKYEKSGKRASPLVLYVYKDSNWNDTTKAAFVQTQLANCSGFVFTYSTWEEPPLDLQTLPDKEIANTLKAFKTSCNN